MRYVYLNTVQNAHGKVFQFMSYSRNAAIGLRVRIHELKSSTAIIIERK